MACTGCNKRRVSVSHARNIKGGEVTFIPEEHKDFVLVKFVPGGTSTKIIPSPSGAAFRYLGKPHYGLRSPGVELWMHRDDIMARPRWYKVVGKEDGSNVDTSEQLNTIPNSVGIQIPPLDKEAAVKDESLLTEEFPQLNGEEALQYIKELDKQIQENDETAKAKFTAKPVNQVGLDREIIDEFPSMAKAAKAANVTSQVLKKAIEDEEELNGFYWEYAISVSD